jgi:hypothetical protein
MGKFNSILGAKSGSDAAPTNVLASIAEVAGNTPVEKAPLPIWSGKPVKWLASPDGEKLAVVDEAGSVWECYASEEFLASGLAPRDGGLRVIDAASRLLSLGLPGLGGLTAEKVASWSEF